MIKGINKRIKKHGYHIQEEPCLLIFKDCSGGIATVFIDDYYFVKVRLLSKSLTLDFIRYLTIKIVVSA